MSIVNAALRPVFDLLLYPFRGLPPSVGLTLVSALTAVFMLVLWKATSNQEKLEAVKRQIHAGLFEIRLFNDDLRAIFRAQGEILRHNLTYFRLALVPMVWMMIPFVLIVGQLHFHYAFRGLRVGEQTLLKVELAEEWQQAAPDRDGNGKPDVSLEVPEGVRVETAPVWIPSLRELAWRIAAERAGELEVRVVAGEESYGKSLSVSDSVRRRAPERVSAGFTGELLNPAEAPLPKGAAVRSIEVDYPLRYTSLYSWMVAYILISIVFAFLLRKPMGVTF